MRRTNVLNYPDYGGVRERLKWAIGRLIKLDAHCFLSFPIFLFLITLCTLEFCLYLSIKLWIRFCEDLSFNYASRTRHLDKHVGGDWKSQSSFWMFFENMMKHLPFFGSKVCKYTSFQRSQSFQQNDESPTTIKSFRRHKLEMRQARTYEEYKNNVLLLDKVSGREEWKHRIASGSYDFMAVGRRKQLLCYNRKKGDVSKVLNILRSCLHKQFGGILREPLYARTYCGTKKLVEDYIDEVCSCLEFVTANRNNEIYSRDICSNLHQISRQWGSTALVLSGGASLGVHHFGVCETLLKAKVKFRDLDTTEIFENSLLPRVICGTSAGAVVASWLCTRNDEELINDVSGKVISTKFRAMHPNNWFRRILNLFSQGYMCDMKKWEEVAYRIFGSVTFLESYKKTNRVLNISMTSANRTGNTLLLNYKNAPNVVISSAVLCSVAFPLLARPFHLLEKDTETGKLRESSEFAGCYYQDGSLSGDVPAALLRDLWGTTFTIVSQVNPHIFPFSGVRANGEAGVPVSWSGRSGKWRGGFILSGLELFFKENIRFILRLIALLDVSPRYRGINCGQLALQSYTGDVTVHPKRLSWRHYRFANDLNEEEADWFIQEGRLMIFPKLALIQNRMRLERAIEKAHLLAFQSMLSSPTSSKGTGSTTDLTFENTDPLQKFHENNEFLALSSGTLGEPSFSFPVPGSVTCSCTESTDSLDFTATPISAFN